MAKAVFPFTNPLRGPCGSSADGLAGCGYSPRLVSRLLSRPGPLPYMNPICRCQNGYQGVTISGDVGSTTAVAHVALSYAPAPDPGPKERLDLLFVKTSSSWEVDDIQCTGNPASSIYALNPGLCEPS
ncbi:MAG: hypothetical protein ACREPA_12630 [Candidatus Dormibacteraceae bacterium]